MLAYAKLTVISTLPHYFCLFYTIPACTVAYSITVGLSTTLSVIWHTLGEPRGLIFYADYIVATLWTSIECWYGMQLGYFKIAVILNITIIVINKYIDRISIANRISYKNWHSIWHIINSFKAIYLAHLLVQYQQE